MVTANSRDADGAGVDGLCFPVYNTWIYTRGALQRQRPSMAFDDCLFPLISENANGCGSARAHTHTHTYGVHSHTNTRTHTRAETLD